VFFAVVDGNYNVIYADVDVKGIFLMKKSLFILPCAENWRKINYAYQYLDPYPEE
jgi:hypothetical protein